MENIVKAQAVYVSNNTFTNNINLVNIDCNYATFVNNDMSQSFKNCVNLTNVVNISNTVTNMYQTFYNCSNLTTVPCNTPASVTNMTDTFHYCANLTETPTIPNGIENLYLTFSGTNITTPPALPSSVTNMYSTFHKCAKLTSAPDIPSNVEQMSYTFSNCMDISNTINIASEKVNTATRCFNNTNKEKTVYIPYKYTKNSENVEEITLNGIIHGNPTNTDGVLSNFSTNNYFIMPEPFDPSTNTWEWCMKIKTGSDISNNDQFIGGPDNQGSVCVEAGLRDGKFAWWLGTAVGTYDITAGQKSSYSVQANTTYWVKLVFTGSAYIFYYSLDGYTYNVGMTTTSSNKVGVYTQILGYDVSSSGTTCVWKGTIDLDECYIKIGNTLWWKGVNRKCKKNYKVIGTLTDNHGEISGFSSSSYIKLNEPFSPGSKVWEIRMKFTTPDTLSGENLIFQSCKGANNSGRYGIGLWYGPYNGNMKFDYFISSDGSSWLFDTYGSTIVQPNTTYYVRFGFNGSGYFLDISLDGMTYINDVSITNSNPVYSSLVSTYIGIYSTDLFINAFKGSIDLNECYIFLDGQEWWRGITYANTLTYKTFQKLYPPEPNGTTTGTLTNDSGIISGFSANNYLTIANSFNPYSDVYEIGLKIRTGSSIANVQPIFDTSFNEETGLYLGLYQNVFWVSGGNGSSWIIDGGTYTALPNTDYWVKFIFNKSEYAFMVSTDGIHYTDTLRITSSAAIDYSNTPRLGWCSRCTSEFLGSIDLNYCYIKVNGAITWKGTYNIFDDYYRKSDPNGTLSGTVTSNNSVLSGFSGDGRLILPSAFNPGNNPWEAILKIRVNSNSPDTWNSVLGLNEMSGGMNLHISSTGHIKNEFSSTGYSWNLGSIEGSYVLQPNTYYWIRTGWKNNQYYLDLSLDSINYTSQGTINSSTPIYNATNPLYIGNHYGDGSWKYFRGAIDLNECKITISNKVWWQGSIYQNNGILFKNNDATPPIYATWKRPTLTNNFAYGTCSTIQTSPTSPTATSTYAPHKALDNDSSTYAGLNGNATGNVYWWKWELPEEIIFLPSSIISFKQRNTSEGCGGWRFYADEKMTQPLGPTFSTSGLSAGSNKNMECSILTAPIKTRVIYLRTDSVSSWPGMAELNFYNVLTEVNSEMKNMLQLKALTLHMSTTDV